MLERCLRRDARDKVVVARFVRMSNSADAARGYLPKQQIGGEWMAVNTYFAVVEAKRSFKDL